MWRKIKDNFLKWLDQLKLAMNGVLLAFSYRIFRVPAIIAFIFFGTIMNLLSGGFAAFTLIAAADFPAKLKIIFDAFLGIFGVNRNFLDWLLVFLIALLQGLLIGLVIFIWKRQKRAKKSSKIASGGAQSAGIATGLAILGAGCPTCGTALVTPILSIIFSSGGYAIAGLVSGIITALAIVVSFFALKKVGLNAYVIIVNERNLEREGAKNVKRKS